VSLTGRRVLLTGQTGFKGAWLALWLERLGAEVHGVALPPATTPSLYELAGIEGRLASARYGDLRDRGFVERAVARAQPELVIHMGAQAIVRRALVDPVETWETNVVGTANLLSACTGASAVLVITSDKCYRDVESGRAMREDDPLGGKDPYSASKAAQEIVAHSYARTVLGEHGVTVATARAGNVIGGGDWAADRLVPDLMRAALAGDPVVVRSPDAVRPWQHVLNPLSGYLTLCERLLAGEAAEAWNFGPAPEDELPVGRIVEQVAARWPGGIEVRVQPDPDAAKEASVLRLDSSKARERLGWSPRWGLERALAATVDWYAALKSGADVRETSLTQIEEFQAQ
jgi:CDP-glucose 4,6-dehydratase